MLEIQQNQPHYQLQRAVSFKGRDDYEEYRTQEYGSDYISKEDIEAERDEKLDKVNDTKRQFDDLADELENSDNKYVQKSGKLVRFGATLLGVVGTFVVAKYSSKMAIETLKSAVKSPAAKSVAKFLQGAEKPASKAVDSLRTYAAEVMKNPKVNDKITKLSDSKVGKVVQEFLANEKVKKVLEPVTNTLKSIKDIKVNGKTVQSTVENVMAGATTGSVIVDDLTGRNNDKSVVDLATGA